MSQPFSGSNGLGRQVIEISTADITQFDALEIIPDALIGIEIGGMAGQLFHMQTFGRSSPYVLLSCVNSDASCTIADDSSLVSISNLKVQSTWHRFILQKTWDESIVKTYPSVKVASMSNTPPDRIGGIFQE